MKMCGICVCAAAFICAAGSVGFGRDSAAVELARIPVDDDQLVVGRDGGLALLRGEQVLIRGSRLVIAARRLAWQCEPGKCRCCRRLSRVARGTCASFAVAWLSPWRA